MGQFVSIHTVSVLTKPSSIMSGRKINKEPVHVIVTVEIRKSKYEKFLAALKPMVEATNKEKGCVRYDVHQDKKNKYKFVIMEEWESQKYLTRHLQQEHVAAFNKAQKEEEMHTARPNVFFCGGPLIET